MSNRRLAANFEEKEEAGKILQEILFTGEDDENTGIWLHDYLQNRSPGVEKIIASNEESMAKELDDKRLPRVLVDLFGSEIFEGKFGARLRGKILDKILEKGDHRKIFKIYLGTFSGSKSAIENLKVKFKTNPREEAKKYVHAMKENRRKHPWRAGGHFARTFVGTLRLADIFAGIQSDPSPSRVESAIPKADVKELKNFQVNMKKQVIEILEGSNENRAIVTLPTGAGKTRIVVEAIVEFLNKHGVDTNILWIAQSQEVCEQAVLCFKQVWEQKGKGEILNIFRAWGKNELPTADERGVVVGGYQKLVSRVNELQNLSRDKNLAAVFIDEAHHSVAKSYGKILKALGMSVFVGGILENESTPLIGLTATPERRKDSETENLHRMYGDKRIYPSERVQPNSDKGDIFGEQWKDLGHMRRKLIDLKYLAEPTFHSIEPGKKIYKLTPTETEDLKGGGELWIERIATETERNRNIKEEILKWAKKGKKILYFGTNVSQSNAMARILEKENISSVCITGDTRYAARKLFVDTFNEQDSNKIQVMCNYNVLSTGFDSPQIDTVIIARPTTSVVSYQQMVGRGLRGEEFGGKAGNRCDIVTVKDNIVKFNDERVDLGYKKYDEEIEQGPNIPIEGETFTEDRLYELFHTQKYGGIRYTNQHNYVILIDSDFSNYKDRVDEETGTIIYTGTGEKDQGFDKGVEKFNAKVKDPNSILLYFQKPEPNKIIFKYLARYESHYFSTEKNIEGRDRKVIKFKLKIIKE
jgi:superfamily II DNA or RNA helicase